MTLSFLSLQSTLLFLRPQYSIHTLFAIHYTTLHYATPPDTPAHRDRSFMFFPSSIYFFHLSFFSPPESTGPTAFTLQSSRKFADPESHTSSEVQLQSRDVAAATRLDLDHLPSLHPALASWAWSKLFCREKLPPLL